MKESRKQRRTRTADRGPPSAMELAGPEAAINPRQYGEPLGPKRAILPNGSMLCEDVVVARTGWMIYTAADGLPIPPTQSGIVYIERTDEELFDAETLASLIGVAVTDDHPSGKDDWVNPRNWEKLSKGFCLANVRRGTGEDSDVILADIIVTSQSLIDSINGGKREISAGYDAEYELTGPGQGRQSKIRFNHIALVERGRCGPRCAIGDQAPTPEKEITMPQERVKVRTASRVRDDDGIAALRATADAANQALAAAESDLDEDAGTHIHIHTGDGAPDKSKPATAEPSDTDKAIATLTASVGALAKTVDALVKKTADKGDDDDDDDEYSGMSAEEKAKAKDKKKKMKDDAEDMDDEGDGSDTADKKKGKAKDSAALETSYKALTTQCEILVPGFRMPAFDSAAPRKLTVDGMCKQRTRALDLANMTDEGATLIATIAGKAVDLETMDCSAKAMLFNAVVAARAQANNKAHTADASSVPLNAGGLLIPKIGIAQINEANAKFWDSQTKH